MFPERTVDIYYIYIFVMYQQNHQSYSHYHIRDARPLKVATNFLSDLYWRVDAIGKNRIDFECIYLGLCLYYMCYATSLYGKRDRTILSLNKMSKSF